MHKYFLITYRKTKGEIHQKLSILQKPDPYLNQFPNKKGAIGKPEWSKKHPIWAAHPRTYLSTKSPPPRGRFMLFTCGCFSCRSAEFLCPQFFQRLFDVL